MRSPWKGCFGLPAVLALSPRPTASRWAPGREEPRTRPGRLPTHGVPTPTTTITGLQGGPWGALLSRHCPRGPRRGGRLAPGPAVLLRNDSLMPYKWYLLWCLNHSDGKPPHSGEQGRDGADISASRGERVPQAACVCWPSPAVGGSGRAPSDWPFLPHSAPPGALSPHV